MGYDREVAEKEFVISGEARLMEFLSGKLDTIFDVGSNIGEWTRLTRKFNPKAKIHTFEVMPQTYEKLLRNLDLDENTIPNGFGLADYCGLLPMKYIESYDAMSTSVTNMYKDDYVWKNGLVMTGDAYVQSREIKHIDFLKIDTEGAEKKVLDGLKETIDSRKVGMIQFEYGYINILMKWMLVDYYEYFLPRGYRIGKITPEGVNFSDYNLTDEDFKGPNYLAVHESLINLF